MRERFMVPLMAQILLRSQDTPKLNIRADSALPLKLRSSRLNIHVGRNSSSTTMLTSTTSDGSTEAVDINKPAKQHIT